MQLKCKRLRNAYTKAGREFTERQLKEEAADIVRNNIPNYDYVSDFVKSLRKLPIGNFVSFPAEIVRTGTNIVRRGLREINESFTLADGTVVKPFETIGYTRLIWFWCYSCSCAICNTKSFYKLSTM